MEMANVENIKKQYLRYWLAEDDIDEVQDIVDLIGELKLLERENSPRDLELKVFSTAVVVSYARAFVKSRSASNARAASSLPESILGCLTAEQLALHRKLLKQRDQELAHTDIAPTELKLELTSDGDRANFTGTRTPLNRSELQMLKFMIAALQEEINRRMNELRALLPPRARL
jgi:hypothetical protein